MVLEARRMSDEIVAREPLGVAGTSGNILERVVLRDGRRLVRKEISPQWDWISRATRDDGRVVKLWEQGLFERIPASLDHMTVAAEHGGDRWTVFMREVPADVIVHDRKLSRQELRLILSALADMHMAFWGERHDDLCRLEDRYNLLSPATGRAERARGERPGELIAGSWEQLAELLPADLFGAIHALAEDPAPLVAQLNACEQTLIHGDVHVRNFGLDGDRVIAVDWGERTGTAPAPVELAWFLIFDGQRFDASEDEVVADFRSLYGDRFDEKALELALIGGLVQLGCNFALPIVLGGGDDARAVARRRLSWWIPKVSGALEKWF